MTSRTQLRTQMRARRRALSITEQQQSALLLAQQLSSHPLFLRSKRIACYFANDGEIDPWPLMEQIWKLKKLCFLPVLRGRPSQRLWFAPYRLGDPLVNNRYQIPEPAVPFHKLTHAWSLDLVLTPLVAFDRHGNRLGMGGGYYDRTLAFLTLRRHWVKPRVLGVAYEFQQVDKLPAQAWDVPLHGIATDAGIIDISHRHKHPGT